MSSQLTQIESTGPGSQLSEEANFAREGTSIVMRYFGACRLIVSLASKLNRNPLAAADGALLRGLMRLCQRLSLRKSPPTLLHEISLFWLHEAGRWKVAHEFRVVNQVQHPKAILKHAYAARGEHGQS
jgi:hypothetical protein